MTTSSSAVLPARSPRAVDRALDLACSVLDALEGEGRGHAQVVVRVHGDDDVLDADDVVREALDAATEVLRQLVAGGVRDVHDGGARLDDGLDHALEERLVRTAGVLGVELDVLHVLLGVLDAVDGALDALVLGDAQLVAQVGGRDADAGVDARALGALERLGRAVDVLLHRAREAADHAVVAGQTAILLHGAEVPGEEMGKPASITSTPRRMSCWAMTSFSSVFMDAPGLCSPSRRVVSKMWIFLVMAPAFLVVPGGAGGVRRSCRSKKVPRPLPGGGGTAARAGHG